MPYRKSWTVWIPERINCLRTHSTNKWNFISELFNWNKENNLNIPPYQRAKYVYGKRKSQISSFKNVLFVVAGVNTKKNRFIIFQLVLISQISVILQAMAKQKYTKKIYFVLLMERQVLFAEGQTARLNPVTRLDEIFMENLLIHTESQI